jgi:bacterioferritin-associated ferredoxin
VFVCLCNGITSQVVADAIAAACGAGADCGRCRRTLRNLLGTPNDGRSGAHT